MPADASVYGQIRPATPMEGSLDQYGKVLNLKALMGQSKLHDLQTQQLEQNIGEEQATRDVFSRAPQGATLESLLPDVMRASPKAGISMTGQITKQKQEAAQTEHTQAQTQDITAGHIAGAWASLAKAGGSDEAVKQVHDTMAPLVGEEKATAVTQKLLAMPPEMRLPWMTAQAGTHKAGQEALKIFFPPAHMQDAGGQITPVSTSTLPGGPAAGSPIPGGQPLVKTQTPDSVVAQETARRGQNMVDARTRELNGIMEGQTAEPPSPALVKSIATGEMDLKPPPTNARNPIMLQRYGKLLEAVKAENPNYSAEMFPTIKKTVAAFAAGKEGQTIKALNTATDHLETLRELSGALQNGNVQLFNKIANQYAANTGNPAPSNLSVASQVIGGEIVKGIVGAGGGVGERERAEAAFSNVKSPADLEGALNTVTKLMGGQFKGMQKQYEAGTYGRKDFAEKYLTPAAQKALEAAQAPHGGLKQDSPAAAPGRIVPAKGTVQEGFRFKGGNPADQASWEKV